MKPAEKKNHLKQLILENKFQTIVIFLGVFLFFWCGYLSYQNHALNKIAAENAQANQQNSRVIYVYNMEKAVHSTEVDLRNKKFNTDLAALEIEVQDTKDKIKKIKDAKVKDDISEIYLKSLMDKRDNLVNDYQNYMTDMLDKMNKALAEVATEHNAVTIFNANSMVVTTKDVIDVTDEVVQKVTAK